MVRYIGGYKKGIAIDLRKRGNSYSEIANSIHVPKSTVVEWVKRVKLSKEQSEKLNQKRLETAKANSKKRVSKNLEVIEEINLSAPKAIREISKKELWLIGTILYWKSSKQNSKSVSFSSKDQFLIKLFLKWIREVGRIEDDEIVIDLFIRSKLLRDKLIRKWSRITGLSKRHFSHVYFQKRYNSDFIRVRVKRSSPLALQIEGWIRGIANYYNFNIDE